MMRILVLLHRWLGVAFCLLFAMWFATGIVMHFVPFPALSEADRFAGLAPLDLARAGHGPAAAVAASAIKGATRVHLTQRSDGPVFVVSGPSAIKAVRAADLADGAVQSGQLAVTIAADYSRRRYLDFSGVAVDGPLAYDQWTISGSFDPERPLYLVALNDALGTELYVSSRTGQVVLATTRRQRAWNYVGSIAHWIYPAALRGHPAAWSTLLWWLSLLALIGASAGAVVGVLRTGTDGSRLRSPYSGLQAWHHCLGLLCMLFVLTWIFSGWLSLDDGRLFSTGKPEDWETAAVTGSPDWNALPADQLQGIGSQTREAEWFAFGGRIYRRERTGLNAQRLAVADRLSDAALAEREFLTLQEAEGVASRISPACGSAAIVDSEDPYASTPLMPNAPVFRVVCGSDWFDIDGSNGAMLEKLDPSRRVYRWLFTALHTLDFPVLTARPALRTALVVALCGCGLVFSLTGVVLAWRRLLSFLE
jgi:hypothetical protein